jgi:hypothetical protein
VTSRGDARIAGGSALNCKVPIKRERQREEDKERNTKTFIFLCSHQRFKRYLLLLSFTLGLKRNCYEGSVYCCSEKTRRTPPLPALIPLLLPFVLQFPCQCFLRSSENLQKLSRRLCQVQAFPVSSQKLHRSHFQAPLNQINTVCQLIAFHFSLCFIFLEKRKLSSMFRSIFSA